jgi:hypothetical protein
MGYLVLAGYVTVETAVPGGRAKIDIQRGRELPGDVPAEQVQALLGQARIVLVGDPEPAGAAVRAATSDELPRGTIAEILGWVGTDATRAARALEREQGSGRPRSKLVEALAKVTEAGPPSVGEPPAGDRPSGDLPDGDAAAVLAWVDGDPDRARHALDAEVAKDAADAELVDALTEAVDADPADGRAASPTE